MSYSGRTSGLADDGQGHTETFTHPQYEILSKPDTTNAQCSCKVLMEEKDTHVYKVI